MTVGATKIQIIQENALTTMAQENSKQESEKQQTGDVGCEP